MIIFNMRVNQEELALASGCIEQIDLFLSHRKQVRTAFSATLGTFRNFISANFDLCENLFRMHPGSAADEHAKPKTHMSVYARMRCECA